MRRLTILPYGNLQRDLSWSRRAILVVQPRAAEYRHPVLILDAFERDDRFREEALDIATRQRVVDLQIFWLPAISGMTLWASRPIERVGIERDRDHREPYEAPPDREVMASAMKSCRETPAAGKPFR